MVRCIYSLEIKLEESSCSFMILGKVIKSPESLI